MPDTDTSGDASKTDNKPPAEQAGTGGASTANGPNDPAGAGAGSDPKQTDAKGLNPDPGNAEGAKTPEVAAKDPAKDPSVAGTKLFPGGNAPATAFDPKTSSVMEPEAAILTTDRKVTGVDVTQPPALDRETGLARTTLFDNDGKGTDDKLPA